MTTLPVTDWDITHGIVCVDCAAPFQPNGVKVERDTGKGWAEDVCVDCA